MTHFIRCIIIITAVLIMFAETAAAEGVTYRKFLHGRAVYDTILIDLKNRNALVTLQVPGGFPLRNASFSDFIKVSQPDAAITGTYFNMSTYVPVGDMAMFGKPIHYGEVGTSMAITPDREVFFSRSTGKFISRWNNFETILAAGPTVLKEGKLDIHPELESFTDRRIFGLAKRCAAGYRPDGYLVLATSRGCVSLSELGRAFLSMGCTEAMNLDGGSSSALYYHGSYYSQPRRKLTNLLIVFGSQSRYDSYRKSCASSFHQTGELFMKRGKYFQAMLNFRGATAADPTNAAYFDALARMYEKLEWPLWSSWALSRGGEIYDRKGVSDRALDRYRKALDISHQNEEAIRWMIGYHQKNGDAEMARKEKDCLRECLFLKTALTEDLYAQGRPLFPELSWNATREGTFTDNGNRCTIKLPSSWTLSLSTPSYALFACREPSSRPLYVTFEAIKCETFVSLDRTVEEILKKRNTPKEGIEKLEISGCPAALVRRGTITVEEETWNISTLLIKRYNRVFILTAGAPQEMLPALTGTVDSLCRGVSFEKE